MKRHGNMSINEKQTGLEALTAELLGDELFKENPELLKIAIEKIDKIKEIESQREDTFFKDIAKHAGNKISKYVSYEPEDNKKVKEIFGSKIPSLVGEYNNELSFLEIVDDLYYDIENKEELLVKMNDRINDTKEKIELACKFKKKIAIVYTKAFKKQIDKIYTKLSSEEKKLVKLLYIDPEKDELDEIVNAIKKWLIWAEISYTINISAVDIFLSK